MIEIKYTRDGVPEDIRYFKTVNEYVNWIFAERILCPEVKVLSIRRVFVKLFFLLRKISMLYYEKWIVY